MMRIQEMLCFELYLEEARNPFLIPCNDLLVQRKETAHEETPAELARIERQIWIWAGTLTVVFLFAWPLLALPAGVFSKVTCLSSGQAYLSKPSVLMDAVGM